MKQTLLLFLLLFSGLLQQAWAQDRTISGKVIDRATNQGLPGVTIIVKDKGTIGTSTNSDGAYSLPVPAGTTTLVFSFVGYATQEVTIGSSNTININLATDSKQLNEVVVTALGVERSRNSLAYSATQVTGNDVTVARNPNAINGLSGKVAGLAITQTNTLGGSSNVVIRGVKSISGNNQALFVVDGVPISNANTNSSSQQVGSAGYDYGNAAADINPDDIASTTVLKGAAATALYGERAANGVILITTKKGRKSGIGVTVNTGVTMGRIDKSTFIKYQKQYGGGYSQYFNTDDNGNNVVPSQDDASYGNPFNPSQNVLQWGAFTPGSPTFGQATPWVAAENDPSSFFKTGVSTLNSIVIDGGSETGSFKLGYVNDVQRGVLPNSNINKNTVNFNGSLNLTPKLTVSTAVNYTRLAGLGRYGTGYGAENPMTNFRQWWQTNVDIREQKEAYERYNTNATWNLYSPETGNFSAAFWNNPYFLRYKNFENDSRYRTFGNVMANYKVFKGFEVVGRVTADSYDEMQEERSAIGSTTATYNPYYSRYNHTYREFNYDLFGNFSREFNDKFSLRGVIGANMRRVFNNSIFASTNGGLVVPELYSLSNSTSPINTPTESVTNVGVDGLFASATFGYRERIFLDLTARRDKSTTLPIGNNAYIYPSAALGYVFSEDLADKTPWLSYGKIRANYAQVGSSAQPLSVNNVYGKPAIFNSQTLFAVPSTRNNPDLRPEKTRSAEIGLETAFLQNRLGLDLTLYQQNSLDQIIPVAQSAASGNLNRYINSGNVRNRGVEIAAYVVPVRMQDFNWRISANWSRNENIVISLPVDNVLLANYQGGLTSNATVGRAFGSLRGSDYVYLNGQRVVGPNGYYLTTDANQVIGDPNPRWRGGVTNTITYKTVSLNFLIDVRSGGSIFSLDRYYGLATGLQPETAGTNDLGNPSRNTLANGGGVIVEGVQADGSPNKVRVSNSTYGLYGYLRNPNSTFVYDASYVKLREVSLTFGLPKALLAKTPFLKTADLSLVGRNLWIIHKNLPDADPEDLASSGNFGLGFQGGSYPATRTIGANIRIGF